MLPPHSVNPPGGSSPAPPDRLYASPEEALKKVGSEFEYWTGRLTDASTQMCYALIGANWAVFGSVQGILVNTWAKWSLLLVLITLATGVAGAWYLSEALRWRVAYAEKDLKRWAREYDKATQEGVAWPFTRTIENLGLVLRWIKSTFTLASGVLLIIAALTAKPQSPAASPAPQKQTRLQGNGSHLVRLSAWEESIPNGSTRER